MRTVSAYDAYNVCRGRVHCLYRRSGVFLARLARCGAFQAETRAMANCSFVVAPVSDKELIDYRVLVSSEITIDRKKERNAAARGRINFFLPQFNI